MIISALLASAALSSVQDQPILLNRVFAKGEKLNYQVNSNLQIQVRGGEFLTFMPQDLDINYGFTYEVTALKPDGYAVIRYKRPTMTEIQGETVDSAPKSNTVKMNMDYQLTISPINEIVDSKDLYVKPTPKKGGKKGNWTAPAGEGAPMVQNPMGFVGEIQRLALFIGSFDSALDFSPKLPHYEIKVGDTWQRTVGYTPQKLKGKDGKSAVRRLDYTYTYKGVQMYNGKPYHRVTADLKMDEDIAGWMHEAFGATKEQTNVESFKLQLTAHIDYDLDVKTRRTVRAIATSNGGMQLFSTHNKSSAYMEQKIAGKTVLSLKAAKL